MISDGALCILFGLIALPIVIVAGVLRWLLVRESRPEPIPMHLPPQRRLEIARVEMEAARNWLNSTSGWPTGTMMALRNFRFCLSQLQEAEKAVRALKGAA